MKKNQNIFLRTLAVASLTAALATVTACSTSNNNSSTSKVNTLTDSALNASEIADFTKGEADTFFASDGWSNGSVFNCKWKSDHMTYSDEAMHLTISQNDNGSEATNDGYFGGEARSYQYFGYGDYEVKMRPANKEGTASTFFTCTGSYDTDAQGNPNPWDEIDIEFLGKDTTKVQFNYYVNGVGGHEYMYSLGFDASKEYHEYGYRWASDSIVWFVDDKPVYKVEKSEENPLPSTPGRILMNYWCGTKAAEGWMGSYGGSGRNTADYQWVHSSATPIGNLPTPEGDVEVPAGEAQAFTFTGDECYEIVQPEDKKSLTVNYNDMQGETYSNVLASAPDGVGKNKFVFTVKNNGAKDATVRVNMQGEKKSGNTDCCNVSAAATNKISVETDLNWGGSKFVLGAGKETTVVVTYTSNGAQGKLQNVMFMIDSCINADTEKHTGSVTFTNMYFAGEEEVSAEPAEPEGDQFVVINEKNVSFTADNGYTLSYDNEKNSLTASYTDIAGNSYLNFNANVRDIALGKTTFTTKIKNNGANEALIRVDMEGENTVTNSTNANGHKDCATSSSATNGVSANTDLVWAGSSLRLAAGQETVLTVNYTSNAAYGKITTLKLFVDDSQYDDTSKHTGSVTFSEMAFSGEEEVQNSEEGDQFVVINEKNVSFTADNGYTLSYDNDANSLTASYTDIAGNSYLNFNANVRDIALGKTTFTTKIKNNGANEALIRVDMEGENTVTNSTNANGHKDCATSSSATNGVSTNTDLVWAGSSLRLAAGQETVLTVNYTSNSAYGKITTLKLFVDDSQYDDTSKHTGSVTFSEMAFSGEEEVQNSEEGEETTTTSLTFNSNDSYTVDKSGQAADEVTVTYSSVATNSYANFGAAVPADAADKTKFSFTCTNNSDHEVTIRIDMSQSNTNKSTGISSENGKTCWFNAGDSAYLRLAANEGDTFTVTYTDSPDYICIFAESTYSETTQTHSGSLTLKNFEFKA